MTDLRSNLETIYYANYLGQEELLDDDGNKTGEFVPTYSDPISIKVCVSSAKGTVQDNIFGALENYDRVMTTANANCPIEEKSILWIGVTTDENHNYIVRQVARWKNSVSYAIAKVDVAE